MWGLVDSNHSLERTGFTVPLSYPNDFQSP
jgi:hypothetical protein